MKVIKREVQERNSAPLRAIQPKLTRLALHLSEGLILLDVHDILYCSAEGNYTHIHACDDRHYLVSKTLKQVELKLAGKGFFRAHQSHLVSIAEIFKVSAQNLEMTDHKILPLARSKRGELMQRLNQMTISI